MRRLADSAPPTSIHERSVGHEAIAGSPPNFHAGAGMPITPMRLVG
jgi:hypothetical protein